MPFILALLFSLSSNLDNFVIGFSYGVQNKRIALVPNMIIALITAVVTYLSMVLGQWLTHLISHQESSDIGSIVFIGLGLWSIGNSFSNNKKTRHDDTKELGFKAAIGLGILLSINNIGVGILGSVSRLNINLITILTFVTSILLTYLGNHLGNNVIGKWLGKYNDLVSGLLLVILGLLSFFYAL
ncbi:manganese efflux pump MntP [Photobacterium leiognathi]|uniref:manganese efflux pump MntP n=1 Tax=Photobacterium leiognathi TaxID=553611 RepID=UPI0029810E9F|nr:manganese efflux pump [Photobacterium leiognathi]